MLQLTPELVEYLKATSVAAAHRAERKATAKILASKRRMNRQKFRQLVDLAAATMRLADPSPFAFEGAWRQHIRSSLVLDGWKWADADQAAREVVETALRQIGASRPSWQQGQPEWTQPAVVTSERTRCLQCEGRLDPANKVFCSARCRDAHNHKRHYHDDIAFSRAKQRARWAAWSERQPERQCMVCEEPFKPKGPKQVLCSNRCGVIRMRGAVRMNHVCG